MEDKERTLYCGNLSDKVTEDLLYELFLQAGPLENVTIPKDKDGRQRNFAFITFKHTVSVPYSIALMNEISLYGRPLRLDARSVSDEPNPYIQRLEEYRMSVFQRGYQPNDRGYGQQNDNRYNQNDMRYPQNDSRHHDSRRHQSRVENPRSNVPVIYPNFVQPFLAQQLPQLQPPLVSAYPNPYLNAGLYGSYPSARSGYRR